MYQCVIHDGGFSMGEKTAHQRSPTTTFQRFHFESPIHRSLINLITMGFHILFPHSFVSPSLWWLDPIVYAFLSFRVHWIFIEMEANGKSSKRSILWAPAEIIQSRYSVKLMSRIFLMLSSVGGCFYLRKIFVRFHVELGVGSSGKEVGNLKRKVGENLKSKN